MKLSVFWVGFLVFASLTAVGLPLTATAVELNVQSETLMRVFSRDTATKNDAVVAPAYQYLQIDIDNSGEPGLAFHLYGWGRADLADNNYYDDRTAGELLYGYLEYTHELAHFNARLGRQYIFEGVANESVDGLRISSDLGKYFSGSLYAGQPADLSTDNGRTGDSIYGGRLAHHLAGLYNVGFSYKKIRSDSEDAEEKAGVDLSAYLPADINLYGFSSYSLDSNDWAEHSYELRIPVASFSVRPYFQQFRYDAFFGNETTGFNPFRILADSNEELTILGSDLTFPVAESWTLVATAKNYGYSVLDDNAQYFSFKAILDGGDGNQYGGEVGVMNGDTAQNQYTLLRLYASWGALPEFLPLDYVSSDIVYVDYDEAIYNQDSSFFVSLGVGKKFMDDALNLKFSADYSSDPYFDEDVRGMLTVSYRFGKEM